MRGEPTTNTVEIRMSSIQETIEREVMSISRQESFIDGQAAISVLKAVGYTRDPVCHLSGKRRELDT
jgi:hypothetical protein